MRSASCTTSVPRCSRSKRWAAGVDLVVLSGARPRDDSTGTNALELEQVVFPWLGLAAPTIRQVFSLPADSRDVGRAARCVGVTRVRRASSEAS